jgi:hypothetical protein
MSVNFGRSNRFEWAHRDLGLRCPGCGHRENVLIDDQARNQADQVTNAEASQDCCPQSHLSIAVRPFRVQSIFRTNVWVPPQELQSVLDWGS